MNPYIYNNVGGDAIHRVASNSPYCYQPYRRHGVHTTRC